jgi:plasmid stabilization system protein ParE
MSKPLVLSNEALQNLDDVTDYLIKTWGIKTASVFLSKMDKFYKNVTFQPRLFPFINKRKRIRKCAVTKYNLVLYRETKYFIEVIIIFDTRQNPRKLKERI